MRMRSHKKGKKYHYYPLMSILESSLSRVKGDEREAKGFKTICLTKVSVLWRMAGWREEGRRMRPHQLREYLHVTNMSTRCIFSIFGLSIFTIWG